MSVKYPWVICYGVGCSSGMEKVITIALYELKKRNASHSEMNFELFDVMVAYISQDVSLSSHPIFSHNILSSST